MAIIPDVITLTDIKQRSTEVFEQIRSGPVIVTHRGDTAGVFATVELWNQREAELARLQRSLNRETPLAQMRAGEYIDITDVNLVEGLPDAVSH